MAFPSRSAIQKCSPVRARWSYTGPKNSHIRAISSGFVPPGAATVPVRLMKSTSDFRKSSNVAYESAIVARRKATVATTVDQSAASLYVLCKSDVGDRWKGNPALLTLRGNFPGLFLVDLDIPRLRVSDAASGSA